MLHGTWSLTCWSHCTSVVSNFGVFEDCRVPCRVHISRVVVSILCETHFYAFVYTTAEVFGRDVRAPRRDAICLGILLDIVAGENELVNLTGLVQEARDDAVEADHG